MNKQLNLNIQDLQLVEVCEVTSRELKKYKERFELSTPVKISDYGITEEFGYLPTQDPAQSLSPGNEAWDQMGKDLPKLMMGSDFRTRVKNLPEFKIENLKTEADLSRAMLVLSYIGQAYQWSNNEAAHVLPAKLALPWVS